MILPPVRNPRLVTIRRGGTLTDEHHHLLGLWAAECAEHVLPLFEAERPDDPRPREAIAAIRAWAGGAMRMWDARSAGGHAMAAARELRGAARHAAFSAGQAGCVGHVAEHDLGAAAYAIKAVWEVSGDEAGREECRWQRSRIPAELLDLVIEDQERRNPDLLERLRGLTPVRRLA